jgi:hypothetical protein
MYRKESFFYRLAKQSFNAFVVRTHEIRFEKKIFLSFLIVFLKDDKCFNRLKIKWIRFFS